MYLLYTSNKLASQCTKLKIDLQLRINTLKTKEQYDNKLEDLCVCVCKQNLQQSTLYLIIRVDTVRVWLVSCKCAGKDL